ncbi:MAG TPA: hypothetical protein PLO06_11295 [Methanoregulaceae archaeon]|nr:hypothetical protein [Methanoregulaceae archaeon]
MQGAGWLNVGSLVFGLIAWILPAINLSYRTQAEYRNLVVLSVTSVSACAIALCLQVLSLNYLVRIGDWSALMDISPTVALVATLLLVVTLTLNAIALVVHFRKTVND